MVMLLLIIVIAINININAIICFIITLIYHYYCCLLASYA